MRKMTSLFMTVFFVISAGSLFARERGGNKAGRLSGVYHSITSTAQPAGVSDASYFGRSGPSSGKGGVGDPADWKNKSDNHIYEKLIAEVKEVKKLLNEAKKALINAKDNCSDTTKNKNLTDVNKNIDAAYKLLSGLSFVPEKLKTDYDNALGLLEKGKGFSADNFTYDDFFKKLCNALNGLDIVEINAHLLMQGRSIKDKHPAF